MSCTTRITLKKIILKDYFKNQIFQVTPIQGDASFRSYDRVKCKDKNFILMNSPPEHYNLRPFIEVANLLAQHHISVPQIYHADEENGFLILEDFGDISIKKHLQHKNCKVSLTKTYRTIIDLLTSLQTINNLDTLKQYDDQILLKELELFVDWYIPLKTSKELAQSAKEDYLSIWSEILKLKSKTNKCFTHRDYHIENMMLVDGQGIKSIGLLDFQDAVIGSPIHDLVSLLEDARFDVDREFAMEQLNYYLKLNHHITRDEALTDYHIFGAQRNSRILGVFARKAVRDKMPDYLQYIPRVNQYLGYDLSHPSLSTLKKWMDNL